MRYEIDNKNAIRIFHNDSNIPFAYQPNWPDNTAWANRAEAETWAQLLIDSMENPDSQFIPGTSPDNHPMNRPEPIDPDTGEPIEKTQPTEEEK